MSKNRSPLVIIFITIFIDLVGFGIVIPVLPLYAEKFGASETAIGLLLGAFSVMQFIFAPILGKLSDRIGRRPVLLVSLIGTAIGFLIMGLADALWLVFVGRIIDGITGGNISTAQAYIADVTPPEQRSKGMGLIGAAFGLGFIVGPVIGGLMSDISPGAPFYFAAALSAANATALYFLLPESRSRESRAGTRPSITGMLRESGGWQLRAVMATYFFATVAFAMMTATYPLFTSHRFEFDSTHNGYLFAFVGMLGVVIQGGLLGRLVKIFGDRALAASGTVVLAIGMFFLPASASVSALILATAALAVGNSLATPTLNGLASKSVDSAHQGSLLGVMASVASLARIIGPIAGGILLEFDPKGEGYGRTPYWTSAAIMLLATLLAATLSKSEEKETIVPIDEGGRERL
jgi:DHA1 family tetracycline resistance protein-like MFS transporter